MNRSTPLLHSFCLVVVSFSLLLRKQTTAQDFISPCPKVFTYEPQLSEPGKWYGTVTLIADADIIQVWLLIALDNPALEIGNWFGEVTMFSTKNYLIKNKKYMLPANIPLPIRFYVRYDPNKPVPQVITIRLNASPICPEYLATSAPPISSNRTAFEVNNADKPTISITSTLPLGKFSSGSGSDEPSEFEDDFFPGDFIGLKEKSVNVDAGSDVECGTVIEKPSALITNGQRTNIAEYPWHVALHYLKDGDSNYTCGGSLISRYHVLTAAHCVSKPGSQSLLDSKNLLVVLGKYYLRYGSNPGQQNHKVSAFVRHPEYNSSRYANDIAVIRLSEPANFTNYVRPICLWEGSTDVSYLIGKFGTIVGWGYDENGRLREELTSLSIPIVSKEVCIYSLPDFYPRFTTLETYCAGFTNGSSACNGDSGGGMVFEMNEGNQNKKAYHLRGLISLSVALHNQAKCDPTHYVVFTDVAKYLSFIKQATAA